MMMMKCPVCCNDVEKLVPNQDRGKTVLVCGRCSDEPICEKCGDIADTIIPTTDESARGRIGHMILCTSCANGIVNLN
jgi:hypothetical protein